jgi:hypothetical protein
MRSEREHAIALATFAAALWLCVNGMLPGSFVGGMIGTRGDHSKVRMAGYADHLDGMLKQAGNGHSVLLRFTGFWAGDDDQADFMRTICRLGNYALCPNRCYSVVDEPTSAAPNMDWLASHDVHAMIWYVRGPEGRVWSKAWDLPAGIPPPQSPPRDPLLSP